MYEKLLKLLDDPKLATAIASFFVVVLGWLTRQLMKIPRYFREQKNTRRNQQSVIDGARRDKILSSLKKTGAIYIHLIRYHNGGGKLKRGMPLNMSVDIEKLGSVCALCTTSCKHYGSVLGEWQNIAISGSWHEVVKKTVLNPHDVHHWNKEQLDHEHREIWDSYHIRSYKETFVKHKKTCFYTIGLSYCRRFTEVRNVDGIISLASRQLANLL